MKPLRRQACAALSLREKRSALSALGNALIPVVTTIGIQFGQLLGGAVLTETVFAIPGMGTTIVAAIKARNTPIVQGGVLVCAISLCVLNLVVDLLYGFIDPRIKSQYK